MWFNAGYGCATTVLLFIVAVAYVSYQLGAGNAILP
jgi:hypothetical protein